MTKNCQVCKAEIPKDFLNELCLDCYKKQVKENEQRLADEKEDRENLALNPKEPIKATQKPSEGVTEASKNGITDPNYKENPFHHILLYHPHKSQLFSCL